MVCEITVCCWQVTAVVLGWYYMVVRYLLDLVIIGGVNDDIRQVNFFLFCILLDGCLNLIVTFMFCHLYPKNIPLQVLVGQGVCGNKCM